MIGLFLLAIVVLCFTALIHHSKAEKRRAEERGEVREEIITPAFQWPPKPRPAVAETRRRAA